MSENVRIDQLAEAVMKGLTEYADLATDDMKKAVKSVGRTVRKEIEANAHVNNPQAEDHQAHGNLDGIEIAVH